MLTRGDRFKLQGDKERLASMSHALQNLFISVTKRSIMFREYVRIVQ